MYSLVLLMMCSVRGLIPVGSFSSAWIRGISSPVSRFLIITLAKISWLKITSNYVVVVVKPHWLCLGVVRKDSLHPSVLYQSWNVDAEGLEFVLQSEMKPAHPHFPEKRKKNKKKGNQLIRKTDNFEAGLCEVRPTASLTCAVTTLSPLVALARSKECCSSFVRLLTVLQGDSRPGGSSASLLIGLTPDTERSHRRRRQKIVARTYSDPSLLETWHHPSIISVKKTLTGGSEGFGLYVHWCVGL